MNQTDNKEECKAADIISIDRSNIDNKGQGYANKLLEDCIADAKAQDKNGLVVLSSVRKMPFLSDPKYLKYKGFKVCVLNRRRLRKG